MQVTHVQDHITHAIIGGHKSREFEMSNSAEFFNILSNSLYSDKILAVVRETLCNAWDIHKQLGKTDVPIEITITPEKFTIKDHGTGIHDDDMVAVYGTYGGSTKKNDGNQTGGFGLGCKSPFAKVDHFEVTSCINHMKTVYAISKSSAEVAGKPSITELFRIPTIETGLTVSFDIDSRDDFKEYLKRVEQIIKFGEMNAILNGEQVTDIIKFSEAKHGFMIIKPEAGIPPSIGGERIFVRYGDVVYPIPQNEKLNDFNRFALEILEKITPNRGAYYHRNNDLSNASKIIFQAKPNTISVTPSRESISMTDNTVNNLQILFKEFENIISRDFTGACYKISDKRIEDAPLSSSFRRVFDKNLSIVDRMKNPYAYIEEVPKLMWDVNDMAKATLLNGSVPIDNYFMKDRLHRLDALVNSGFGNRGKIQSYKREYETSNSPAKKLSASNKEGHPWLLKTVITPIMLRMETQQDVKADKLWIYGTGLTDTKYRRHECGFYRPEKFCTNLHEQFPFLRNLVVIAHNRDDITERAPSHPAFKYYGEVDGCLVYMTPRNPLKAKAAIEFFESMRFTVIDMTRPFGNEIPEDLTPVKVERKPKKKGIPLLSALIRPDEYTIRYNEYYGDDVPRTEHPEFVLKMVSDNAHDLEYLSMDLQKLFIKKFGDKGGLIINANQKAKFKSFGSKPVLDWIVDWLCEEIPTNPNILREFTFSGEDKLGFRHYHYEFIQMIKKSPELRKEFKIESSMSEDDKLALRIREQMLAHYNIPRDMITKLQDLKGKTTTDPNYSVLMQKIVDCPCITLFDGSVWQQALHWNPKNTTDKQNLLAKQKAVDMLVYALG